MQQPNAIGNVPSVRVYVSQNGRQVGVRWGGQYIQGTMGKASTVQHRRIIIQGKPINKVRKWGSSGGGWVCYQRHTIRTEVGRWWQGGTRTGTSNVSAGEYKSGWVG